MLESRHETKQSTRSGRLSGTQRIRPADRRPRLERHPLQLAGLPAPDEILPRRGLAVPSPSAFRAPFCVLETRCTLRLRPSVRGSSMSSASSTSSYQPRPLPDSRRTPRPARASSRMNSSSRNPVGAGRMRKPSHSAVCPFLPMRSVVDFCATEGLIDRTRPWVLFRFQSLFPILTTRTI